jgi:O-antigen/teichoic acid export membrane protein
MAIPFVPLTLLASNPAFTISISDSLGAVLLSSPGAVFAPTPAPLGWLGTGLIDHRRRAYISVCSALVFGVSIAALAPRYRRRKQTITEII